MVIILGIILFFNVLMLGFFYFGFFSAALYTAYFAIVFALIILLFWLQQLYFIFFWGNAPYIRTSRKFIEKLLVEIEIQSGANVYELGCGDARFLRQLAKIKNIRAIGYEYILLPYLAARLLSLSQKNIKLVFGDFFKVDLSEADVIFCFLMPKEMQRLEKKLNQELRPGAMVISNTFQFKQWPLEKEITINPDKNFNLSNKLYIYRK